MNTVKVIEEKTTDVFYRIYDRNGNKCVVYKPKDVLRLLKGARFCFNEKFNERVENGYTVCRIAERWRKPVKILRVSTIEKVEELIHL